MDQVYCLCCGKPLNDAEADDYYCYCYDCINGDDVEIEDNR